MKAVKVYDFDTETTKTIPHAELAPGMIWAKVEGVGLVWVNRSQLRGMLTERRHPPFPARIRKSIRQIRNALAGVDPKTLQQWEDGFRCDLNYLKEIDRWKRIVSFYTRCLAAHGDGQSHVWKQDLYRLALLTYNVPLESVLEVAEFNAMSRADAKEFLEIYAGNPARTVDIITMNNDELQTYVTDADIVVAAQRDDPDPEHRSLIYGRALLKSICDSGVPQSALEKTVMIDFASDELERLIAAVKVAKGHDDYRATE